MGDMPIRTEESIHLESLLAKSDAEIAEIAEVAEVGASVSVLTGAIPRAAASARVASSPRMLAG